jgi:hypothetical protein
MKGAAASHTDNQTEYATQPCQFSGFLEPHQGFGPNQYRGVSFM